MPYYTCVILAIPGRLLEGDIIGVESHLMNLPHFDVNIPLPECRQCLLDEQQVVVQYPVGQRKEQVRHT